MAEVEEGTPSRPSSEAAAVGGERRNDKIIEEQLAAQVREAALARIRAAAAAEFEAGRDPDAWWPQTRFIY